jgi:hypothetical protein
MIKVNDTWVNYKINRIGMVRLIFSNIYCNIFLTNYLPLRRLFPINPTGGVYVLESSLFDKVTILKLGVKKQMNE